MKFAHIVAAVAAVWITADVAAKPSTDTYRVPGLEQPAEILVDEWGVPHIYAKTHYDAFFVQGFNAARDRLWQIDTWRTSRPWSNCRRFSGSAYVAQDRAARLFLFRGDMYREWLAYGSDSKRIAEAFVAGINAFVDLTKSQPALLPPEFELSRLSPGALVCGRYVVRIRSNGLWRNLTTEVDRARILCSLPASLDALHKQLEPALERHRSGRRRPVRPAGERARRLSARKSAGIVHDALPTPSHRRAIIEHRTDIGSNNWVVAPQRTDTGRPILANDPHRDHAVPSLRYAAQLVAPGLNVIGAGEPALPGISIGHNERIAFGLTIFPIDQEDLYVYETRAGRAERVSISGSTGNR